MKKTDYLTMGLQTDQLLNFANWWTYNWKKHSLGSRTKLLLSSEEMYMILKQLCQEMLMYSEIKVR